MEIRREYAFSRVQCYCLGKRVCLNINVPINFLSKTYVVGTQTILKLHFQTKMFVYVDIWITQPLLAASSVLITIMVKWHAILFL